MIKKMRNGDLDQCNADDERHKLSHFNAVPDNQETQPQVHGILRKIGMLPMLAVSACYFECLDAIAASSITRQDNIRKLQENTMTSSRCVLHEVELDDRSLLHRYRATAHGKMETDNDDLLTTSAGDHDSLDAEPTRNASNST